jgi:hypothetical protein
VREGIKRSLYVTPVGLPTGERGASASIMGAGARFSALALRPQAGGGAAQKTRRRRGVRAVTRCALPAAAAACVRRDGAAEEAGRWLS